MAWQKNLKKAIEEFQSAFDIEGAHAEGTGERVVGAFNSMVRGYSADPASPLETTFQAPHDAPMVHVAPIRINSTCMHHLLPIIGVAHFAYIPDTRLVGLSKISRFIDILSARLIVQEELCESIVDTFEKTLPSKGCAVWMKAHHCCMSARGVFEHQAMTTVTSLRGAFRDNEKTRQELYANIDTRVVVIG